jgi:hypothetical protein
MGMSTEVQGRLPLLQCITFHSLLVSEEIVVLKIYPVKHQKSMTRRIFWVLADGRSIGSTHRDILRIHTTINQDMGREFESRVSKSKQMIQFTEGICTREELTRLLNTMVTVRYNPIEIWRSTRVLM